MTPNEFIPDTDCIGDDDILHGLARVDGDDIGITGDVSWTPVYGLWCCAGSCDCSGFTGEKRESRKQESSNQTDKPPHKFYTFGTVLPYISHTPDSKHNIQSSGRKKSAGKPAIAEHP